MQVSVVIHSSALYNKITQKAHTSAKGGPDSESGVRIQIVDPDNFQNVMGTSLSKDTSMIKF